MTSFTNKQLVEAVRELHKAEYNNYLQKYILETMKLEQCSPEIQRDLLKYVTLFVSKLKKKQSKYRTNFDEFLLKNKMWLEKEFNLPPSILSLQKYQKVEKNIAKRGRPKLSYEESSGRTKRKKSSDQLRTRVIY